MKPCPICHIPHCEHERKFYKFGLIKLAIISKSLDATLSIFSTLATFLPTNGEMQGKLALTLDDLKKCKDRISDVKRWCELKAA
jgi:hypothetical protein